MTCPHCQSTMVRRRKQRTALGYHRFSCAGCQRRFNERTGTPFNELQFPTDIVLLAVLWRLRYKLGLRDVAELLLQRGYDVSYETIRAWEFRFAPLISDQLRRCRTGRFCQNSGLAPDFGQEREEKQPRFESETKCRQDWIRRLLGSGP